MHHYRVDIYTLKDLKAEKNRLVNLKDCLRSALSKNNIFILTVNPISAPFL